MAVVGLGLLFLGAQEGAEVTLELCKTISGMTGRFAEIVVETCAYAGTGNVLKVQKMLAICGEHTDKPQWYQSAAAVGIAVIAGGEDIGADMAVRAYEHVLQYGDASVRKAVPLGLGLLHASDPQPAMIELLSRLSHDNDTEVAQTATFSMGLAAAGTNNARAAQLLRQLSVYFSKDPQSLFVVRLAQGLCHMGKGLLGVHPFHSDRLLLHPAALSGVLTVCHCCLDMKEVILGKYHYLLFLIAPAIHPRFLVTLDEDLNTMPVTVRVGQAVDSVAQAGVPKTITGAQTHTTPVLLATNQRAEIADKDTYEVLTPVLEGFVIVKKKDVAEGDAMQQ